MKNLYALILFSTALGSINAFAGDEQKYNGTWHNQFGSEMQINVDSEGRISGKYHTAIGRNEITKSDVWFDVTGVVNGDVISFVVSWGPKSGAISAWSGHYYPKGNAKGSVPQIRTLTHTSIPVSPQDLWKRTTAGADNFEPGPAPVKE